MLVDVVVVYSARQGKGYRLVGGSKSESSPLLPFPPLPALQQSGRPIEIPSPSAAAAAPANNGLLSNLCCSTTTTTSQIKGVCLSGQLVELLQHDPQSLKWLLQQITTTTTTLLLPNLQQFTIIVPPEIQKWRTLVNLLSTQVFQPAAAGAGSNNSYEYFGIGTNDTIIELRGRRDNTFDVLIKEKQEEEEEEEHNDEAAARDTTAGIGGPTQRRQRRLLDCLVEEILQQHSDKICGTTLELSTHLEMEDTFHMIANTGNLTELILSGGIWLGPFEISTLVSALTTTTTISPDSCYYYSSRKRRWRGQTLGTLHQLQSLVLDGIKMRNDQLINLLEGLESNNTIKSLTIINITVHPSFRNIRELYNPVLSLLRHNNTLQELTVRDVGTTTNGSSSVGGDDDTTEEEEFPPFLAKNLKDILKNHNHSLGKIDIMKGGVLIPKTIQEYLILNHFQVRAIMGTTCSSGEEDNNNNNSNGCTKDQFIKSLIGVLEIHEEEDVKKKEPQHHENHGMDTTTAFGGTTADLALVHCLFLVLQSNPPLVSFLLGVAAL